MVEEVRALSAVDVSDVAEADAAGAFVILTQAGELLWMDVGAGRRPDAISSVALDDGPRPRMVARGATGHLVVGVGVSAPSEGKPPHVVTWPVGAAPDLIVGDPTSHDIPGGLDVDVTATGTELGFAVWATSLEPRVAERTPPGDTVFMVALDARARRYGGPVEFERGVSMGRPAGGPAAPALTYAGPLIAGRRHLTFSPLSAQGTRLDKILLESQDGSAGAGMGPAVITAGQGGYVVAWGDSQTPARIRLQVLRAGEPLCEPALSGVLGSGDQPLDLATFGSRVALSRTDEHGARVLRLFDGGFDSGDITLPAGPASAVRLVSVGMAVVVVATTRDSEGVPATVVLRVKC